MFREQALAQLRSSAEYAHPLPVVRSRQWLFLSAISISLAIAVGWACFAEVPVTVDSYGILLHPAGVSQIESSSTGEVVEIFVNRNDRVKKGDALAMLSLPELDGEIDIAKGSLRALQSLDAAARKLEDERVRNEKLLADQKKESLNSTIGQITNQIEKLKKTQEENFSKRTELAKSALERSENLIAKLNERRATAEKLVAENLANKAELEQLEVSIIEANLSRSNLLEQQIQIELQQQQAESLLVDKESELQQLQISLREIDQMSTKLASQVDESRARRQAEIDTQQNTIISLESRKEQFQFIRAAYDGTIVEIGLKPGQSIRAGTVIGAISKQPEKNDEQLEVVAFFSVADGKRIERSATAFVTPSTIKKERYGSIRSEVSEVYAYPISAQEAVRMAGNQEILRPLQNFKGVLGIRANLERTSGNQFGWTGKPPDVELTAGTTVNIQVVVEKRRPISYILPFIRSVVYGTNENESPVGR